jgi:hypothetical protein
MPACTRVQTEKAHESATPHPQAGLAPAHAKKEYGLGLAETTPKTKPQSPEANAITDSNGEGERNLTPAHASEGALRS